MARVDRITKFRENQRREALEQRQRAKRANEILEQAKQIEENTRMLRDQLRANGAIPLYDVRANRIPIQIAEDNPAREVNNVGYQRGPYPEYRRRLPALDLNWDDIRFVAGRGPINYGNLEPEPEIVQDRKPKRTYWLNNELDVEKHRPYHRAEDEILEMVDELDANLVSSLCENGNHAPVIDLDFPCKLIPSSTPGHFHLYIEQEMSWRNYEQLLKALYNAGIIERGFYNMAVARRMTMVRPPGVYKPGTNPELIEQGEEAIIADRSAAAQVARLREQLAEKEDELRLAKQELSRLSNLGQMTWA